MSMLGNVNFVNNYNLFTTGSKASSNLYQSLAASKTSSSSNIYDILNMQYGVNNAKGNSAATSSTVKNLGEDLSEIVSNLTAKGSNSLFNQTGAASTDSKVATATVDNAKFDAAKSSPVELDVKQVAKAQINSGSAVKSTGKEVNSGVHEFAIEIGGKKQNFSINVTASDNNESIQKKMAAAINGKDIGVKASVSYDSTTKTSKLELAATATGNAFTVTDVKGNLAGKMGATQATQKAQNAIYKVNGGEEKTSASNSIDLGNGVTATLKESGKTTLKFQKDGSGSIDQVKKLVSTLNDALSAAYNGEGRGSDRLGQNISDMNKAYSSTLAKVGINVSAGGVLSINEDKLKKAAENGSLEKIFQGNGNTGFASRTGRIADNMANSDYYADQSYTAKNNYGNYGSSGMSSAYVKYSSAGSLLDALF